LRSHWPSARAFSVADLTSGYFLAGVLLALWALLRTAVEGTPGSGLSWVLFGAGTVSSGKVFKKGTAIANGVISACATKPKFCASEQDQGTIAIGK
jgi:hypothetical protein